MAQIFSGIVDKIPPMANAYEGARFQRVPKSPITILKGTRL